MDIWIRILTQKCHFTEMRPWNRAGEQRQGNLSADDGEAMEIEKKVLGIKSATTVQNQGNFELELDFCSCSWALWKCTSDQINDYI